MKSLIIFGLFLIININLNSQVITEKILRSKVKELENTNYTEYQKNAKLKSSFINKQISIVVEVKNVDKRGNIVIKTKSDNFFTPNIIFPENLIIKPKFGLGINFNDINADDLLILNGVIDSTDYYYKENWGPFKDKHEFRIYFIVNDFVNLSSYKTDISFRELKEEMVKNSSNKDYFSFIKRFVDENQNKTVLIFGYISKKNNTLSDNIVICSDPLFGGLWKTWKDVAMLFGENFDDIIVNGLPIDNPLIQKGSRIILEATIRDVIQKSNREFDKIIVDFNKLLFVDIE